MSLKRKCDFDQNQSTSTLCPEDDLITTKYIKTEEFLQNNSPSSDERKYFNLLLNTWVTFLIYRLDESNEKHSISPPSISNESNSEELKQLPQRNRRKNPSQPKRLQTPPSSSSTAPTIPMILNLIDSLVDEKQLEQNNDENLLLTIDNLINNLKHIREKIQTINHDNTHPLNLSKPKIKPHNNDEKKSIIVQPTTTNPTTTPSVANFPLTSTLFSSQPFFSPFASMKFNLKIFILDFLV